MSKSRGTRTAPLACAVTALLGAALACAPAADEATEPVPELDARPASALALDEHTADTLRELSRAELWALGERELGWEGDGPAADVTAEELVERVLADRAFRDLGDFGYPGGGPPSGADDGERRR